MDISELGLSLWGVGCFGLNADDFWAYRSTNNSNNSSCTWEHILLRSYAQPAAKGPTGATWRRDRAGFYGVIYDNICSVNVAAR